MINRYMKQLKTSRYMKQLNKVIDAIPESTDPSVVSLKRLFENVTDDFWFWLLSEDHVQNEKLKKLLPAMPDEKKQATFTGRSGRSTLEQAFLAYKLFKKIARKNGKDLREGSKVLDFGCGWGRIIRFFLKDIEADGLYGIDCQKRIINVCEQSNLRCNLEAINPMPPTNFPDDMFDVIYLYSVFSHLSEEAHLKWLVEFHRILKPGGVLIATTRQRAFITFCADLRKKGDIKPSHKSAAMAFLNAEQALSDYDNGKFCYSPGISVVLDKSFFGQACIPKKYVEENWTKYFPFVTYIYSEKHKDFDQDVIVATKKKNSKFW